MFVSVSIDGPFVTHTPPGGVRVNRPDVAKKSGFVDIGSLHISKQYLRKLSIRGGCLVTFL